MKSEKLIERITFVSTKEFKEKLESEATKNGTTLSGLIKMVLTNYLNTAGKV